MSLRNFNQLYMNYHEETTPKNERFPKIGHG